MKPQQGMSGLEAVCWSVLVGGLLFFLDVWLTSLYKENAPVKQVPVVEHTPREKAILCTGYPTCMKLSEAIVWESRSEPVEGRRLVAQVILNRVHHKNWPNTVEEVIHQPKQFSYLMDMHLQRTPTKEDWQNARTTAWNVLHGLVPDESQGATHYTEKTIQRSWMKNLELVGVVGRHKFMK